MQSDKNDPRNAPLPHHLDSPYVGVCKFTAGLVKIILRIIKLTAIDTFSASERAYEAFPRTRRVAVRASGE